MLNTIINTFFGCSHRRTTFPLTPGRRAVSVSPGARLGTYVVCLDCGTEFSYNWNEMQVGTAVTKEAAIASQAPELRRAS